MRTVRQKALLLAAGIVLAVGAGLVGPQALASLSRKATTLLNPGDFRNQPEAGAPDGIPNAGAGGQQRILAILAFSLLFMGSTAWLLCGALSRLASGMHTCLAQSNIIGVFIGDDDGNICEANDGFLSTFGYSRADLQSGKIRWETIVAPDYLHVLPELAGELAATGVTRTAEIEHLHKDGHRVPALIGLALLKDAPSRVTGFVLDLTRRKRAEEEQRSSERRMKALVDSLEDIVLEVNPEGVCLNVWTRPDELLGRPKSDWIGCHARDIVGPEQATELSAALGRALETGRPEEFEYSRKDALAGSFLARVNPIPSSGGARDTVCVVVQDVSRRKRAEQALHLTQFSMDHAPSTVIWLDPDGRIVYANEAASQSLGYSRQDLLAMTIVDLDPDYSPEMWRAAWSALKSSGSMCFESRHRRRNGDCLAVEISAKFLEFGGRQYSCTFSRDISQRRKIEDQMRQLSLLVENSDDFVALASLDAKMRYLNEAGCRLVGLDGSRDVVGRDIFGFHPESARQRILCDVLPAARKAASWRGELQLRHFRTGELIDVLATVFVIRRPETGEPLCLAAVMRDITANKRVEESLRAAKEAAESANRAKSEFLANMSHEIRTPMNGVLGMIGLILNDDLSARQRQRAEVVRSSAEVLLSLLNDILDLSKIEAHKLNLENADFDLRRVVEGTADLMAVGAREKGLELLCLIEPEVPTRLRGDSSRLRQVLLNLIGNAVKFTERGEVSIRVRLDAAAATPRLRFEVSDTGIGVSPAKAALLFRPFSQADASTTRQYGGSGLGLSIVKRLVEVMGGEVGFESREGGGTRFWFTVELKQQAVGRRPALSLSGKRLLVVDGHAGSRALLGELFTFWNARFEQTGSIDQALARLAADRAFDAVIVDLETPGGGAARLLARSRESLLQTPVVLLAPVNLNADSEHWRRLGFASRVTKPVKQGELGACLAAVLGYAPLSVPAPILAGRPHMDREKRAQLRILLVEDNAVNQAVALGILENLGYRAEVAANGCDAVQKLREGDYDLVLMDCQLPEMDGYEATRLIRHPDSTVRNHRIPIIAMTAHAMAGDREKCLAAGMNGYVPKPIQPAVLEDAIEEWTAASAAHRAEIRSAGAPAESSRAPIFDSDELLNRVLGDEDLARRVVHQFVEDLPHQLLALSSAVAGGDAAATAAAAHAIKGAAANTGGAQLRDLARKMEQLGRAGDLAGAAAALPELTAGLDAALPVMARFSREPR